MPEPKPRFRLSADGLTVCENMEFRHGAGDREPAVICLFAFNGLSTDGYREQVVEWLNTGYASHAALRSGRLA
jgi:hypothetical protein